MGTTSRDPFRTGFMPMGKNNPFADLVPPGGNDATMRGVIDRGAPRGNVVPMGGIPGVTAPGAMSDPMGSRPAAGMTMGPPPAPLPIDPMGPRVARPQPSDRMGSRIPASPMNRAGAAGDPMGPRMGSLADRKAVPMGRSMREAPERRLETAARYGSLRAAEGLVGLKQQQMGRDFQAEQSDLHRQQQEKMFGLEQQAQDGRRQEDRRDRFDMFGLEQAAREREQQQDWQQQVTRFGLDQGADAMKEERVRQQQEADRNRTPNVGSVEVPGSNYRIPFANGHPMGTVPGAPQLPSPEIMQGFDKMGLKPSGANSQGQMQFAPPKAAKDVVPTVKEFKSKDGASVEYRQYNPETGHWHKVKFADENGDGIDDSRQGGGGGAAGAAPAPVPATTKSGVIFKQVPQASTATGQLPSEAYANDLSPEQSLAAAHEDYLQTGNDAALRQHFTDFPSPEVRGIQQRLQQNQQQYDEQQREAGAPPARPLTQAERNPGGLVDRWNQWTPPAWVPRVRGGREIPRPAPEPTQADRNPEGIVARLNRQRAGK